MAGMTFKAKRLTQKYVDTLVERIGDSVFALYDDERRAHTRYEGERHPRSTRAEWNAWAKEHMPNGNCICYPERGIVCGQHDPRYQR